MAARILLASLGRRWRRTPTVASACSTTALDPRVEHLWPLPVPEFGVAALRAWDEAALRARLTGDRVRDNLILNK
jgi:hypothetical protein